MRLQLEMLFPPRAHYPAARLRQVAHATAHSLMCSMGKACKIDIIIFLLSYSLLQY